VREDGIIYKLPTIEIQTLQAYWRAMQVSNFLLHGTDGVRRCNLDMYRLVSGRVDCDVKIHSHRAVLSGRYHCDRNTILLHPPPGSRQPVQVLDRRADVVTV
jgi:hypothetical protein